MNQTEKLKQFFDCSATDSGICDFCMMLPCICPPEEEDIIGMDRNNTSPGEAFLEAADFQSKEIHKDAFPGSKDDTYILPCQPSLTTYLPAIQQYSDEENSNRNRILDDSGQEKMLLYIQPNEGNGDDKKRYPVLRELANVLKPHQIEGFQFMWDALLNNHGCILADYMGLGKTLQVISVVCSFILAGLESKAHRKVLVVCPTICIQNWESEFDKWLSERSKKYIKTFTLDCDSKVSLVERRLQTLETWFSTGGVLLMGYEMFRSLCNASVASRPSSGMEVCCTNITTSEFVVSSVKEKRLEKAHARMSEFLCDPGPDLVILDEGHRIKDPHSLLCKSLLKMATTRRIVLTGYPVQNRLAEYWCMVNFASENFLGSYEEFRNEFEIPILSEGKTDAEKKQKQQKLQALKDRLDSVVLRRNEELLKEQLPPKSEVVIFCRLSSIQKKLYDEFIAKAGTCSDSTSAKTDLLSYYSTLLQISNHPDIVYQSVSRQTVRDTSSSVVSLHVLLPAGSRSGPVSLVRERMVHPVDEWVAKKIPDFASTMDGCFTEDDEPLKYAWASASFFQDVNYQENEVDNSGKMVVLMKILRSSWDKNEKVLVFSQSVATLDIIENILKKTSLGSQSDATEPTSNDRLQVVSKKQRDPIGLLKKKRRMNTGKVYEVVEQKSTKRKQTSTKDPLYYRIDGQTTRQKRMESIRSFNSSGNSTQVMLISTKAGAEGINLHAANRVVLFDVSWNPSHDHQAMCRSHRFGQTKPVFVYRLVSMGTMEKRVYELQVKKLCLSKQVMDDKAWLSSIATLLDPDDQARGSELQSEPEPKPKPMEKGKEEEEEGRSALKLDSVLTECLADYYPDVISQVEVP